MTISESPSKRKRVTPFRRRGDLQRFAEEHNMTVHIIRRRWKNNDADVIKKIKQFLNRQAVEMAIIQQTKDKLLKEAALYSKKGHKP
ncbi:MAG: hypothetical protein MUF71_15780 [Candidatus Kapabacteria bacterium]|jgi:C1A family cysteine protease|nr:hypothetical protein [Candidatus Kapabacteria bacterium]